MDDDEWPHLLYAQFTPRGHSIVMVYNYDIYFRSGPRSIQCYRVTKNGLPGIIYNGVPDWLYEGKYLFILLFNLNNTFIFIIEEIFGSNSAIWMSNDGHLMLYGLFNDSNVLEQKFSWFGTVNRASGNTNLYPEIRSLR